MLFCATQYAFRSLLPVLVTVTSLVGFVNLSLFELFMLLTAAWLLWLHYSYDAEQNWHSCECTC